MAHALSKFATIIAAATLSGVFGAAAAAPKPRPPEAPAPSAPSADPHVIYALEQVVTGPLPSEVQAQLGPLRTLRQVEELLKANNIAFKWDRAQMHSSAVPPNIIKQITALPPGEVFVVPEGSPPGAIMVFNVILGTRPDVTP